MSNPIVHLFAVLGAGHGAVHHHSTHHPTHHRPAIHRQVTQGDYENISITSKVFYRKWKQDGTCGLISVDKTTGKVTGYNRPC